MDDSREPARERPQATSPDAASTMDTERRKRTRVEVLLVLGVSLGYDAIYALIDLIGKLTAHKALNAQTTTLNASHAPGRPWLDLLFQIAQILFGVVPAFLALHFLKLSGPADPVGFRSRRLKFDIGWGVLLAAVIGIPGLGLYLGSRAIGLDTTIVPEALPTVWWTVPVLLLSAVENALLEEVVVVGYLVQRLRELSWSVPMAVAASALLRGSYHLYQGFGGFIGNIAMGIVFAAFFVRFKRVTPLVIAHALLDTFAFVGYALLHNRLGFLGA